MKTKKAFAVTIVVFILLCIVMGAICFRKTHVEIDGEFYKTDVKYIGPNLQYTKIEEINKCTEIEGMFLEYAYENDISSLTDFKKLSELNLAHSGVNSSDSKKIGKFSNLSKLFILDTVIDFEGFNNSSLSLFSTLDSEIKNFNSLAQCSSLRSIVITNSLVDDSIIKSESKYVMKDSRFLDSFDNITELSIYVDNIEDASGICEMDSLQKLTVYSDSFPDEAKKILEDKEIKFILKPSFTSIKNKRYSWTE